MQLGDPAPAADAARRLLAADSADARLAVGCDLLARLAEQTGVSVPELVVPDEHQPHRRRGGRIVYSLQGEYNRRSPTAADPRVARGGKPLGRIRVINRTPARGDVVRPSAFLHTLLHEFCHHHDAEALDLHSSFHTSGFYARLRHLREQIGDPSLRQPRRSMARSHGATPGRTIRQASSGRVVPGRRRPAGGSAGGGAASSTPLNAGRLARLWAIIRDL